MKNVKATKDLCRELTRQLGNDFCIEDEGREMRVYHKSAKRRGMCCASYLADHVETAHALAAVLAAHKAANVPLTKDSIKEALDCFSMAVSHYVYGSPSEPASEVLAHDARAKLAMGGRGYFEAYDIPRKMKVVLLNRCRKGFASISRGVGTDSEGCVYNSCRFSEIVKVA